MFKPANEHDNQVMERLANNQTKVLVGDSHYIVRKGLWKRYKTIIIALPHHNTEKEASNRLEDATHAPQTKDWIHIWEAQEAALLGNFVPAKRTRVLSTLHKSTTGLPDGG